MTRAPKRSLIEVFSHILTIASEKGGVNKTRIVYKANLNFVRAEEYLQLLIELGFLDYMQEGRFATTDKGSQFLVKYKDVLELFGESGSEAMMGPSGEKVKRLIVTEAP
jgi:predicted transcriptional regulator